MFKFSEAVVTQSKQIKKWEDLITKNCPKRFHFLLLLIPAMEALHFKLTQVIENKLPKLIPWLDKDLITHHVFNKFISSIYPILIRTCILEMHLARRKNLLEGDTPEARFDFFIENMRDPANVQALFDKYPMMKEQIDTVLCQFFLVTEELFFRLHKNQAQLIKHFFNQEGGYRLIGIDSSGDTHQQGRSVHILTFSKKDHTIIIVYKPRSLKIEIAFQGFIRWFNQYSPSLPLRCLTILNFDNYGFCEFLAYKACQTSSEIHGFYARLGIWLMLLYTLRGEDIHGENIIAHGEDPMVIDFECLLTPHYFVSKQQLKSIPRFMVYHMDFLPENIVTDKEHKGIDLSALGSEAGGQVYNYFIRWLDEGKDTMHAERFRGEFQGYLNKPTLGQKAVDYKQYEQDFLQGFHLAYKIILDHKHELLAENSPLNAFKQAPTRMIFRDTSTYFHTLQESWHPNCLFNPQARKKQFEKLWAKEKEIRTYKIIKASEQQDLKENNIPYFSTLSDGKVIYNSHGAPLKIPVLRTGFECVLQHINYFINEADLKLQQRFIKNSFSMARENAGIKAPIPAINLKQTPLTEIELNASALTLAKRELDKLCHESFLINGEINWPSADGDNHENWVMALTELDLYDGVPGIGLSFLYGAQIFADERYAQIAKLCLERMLKPIRQKQFKTIASIGAFDGMGGLLYALAAYYRVKADKSIKACMKRLLKRLPKGIKEDKNLDVISGCAGLLVVLLSLDDIFPQNKLSWLCKACVNHILKQYPNPCEFPKSADKSAAQKPLLGMAHGVAGITWAMHQYYVNTPSQPLHNWLKQALAYERTQFNAEHGNWPDYRIFRKKSNTGFGVAWCYGAAGIGLGRMAMATHWHDETIEAEIKIALETTIKHGFDGFACLCHGSLGNLELLWQAKSQNRYYNEKKYLQLAGTLIKLLEKNHLPYAQLIPTATPGLMTGRAGIAYALMRIAHPNIIPAVLLIDACQRVQKF